ncbi:MAG: hypothetical protein G01um101438_428 [Parcubacteria group bacterium Gr01-1014_38]|nr:MAG: hypothetical protein G01um101438_428 [Parcubacteria group bacterium Gr01-1014_38]
MDTGSSVLDGTALGQHVLKLTREFDTNEPDRRRILRFVLSNCYWALCDENLSPEQASQKLNEWVGTVYWREVTLGYLAYLLYLQERLWSAGGIVTPATVGMTVGLDALRSEWYGSSALQQAVTGLVAALHDKAAFWFNVQFVASLVQRVVGRVDKEAHTYYWPPDALQSDTEKVSGSARTTLVAIDDEAYTRGMRELQESVSAAHDRVRQCGEHSWMFLFDREQLHQFFVSRTGRSAPRLDLFGNSKQDAALREQVAKPAWTRTKGGILIPRHG